MCVIILNMRKYTQTKFVAVKDTENTCLTLAWLSSKYCMWVAKKKQHCSIFWLNAIVNKMSGWYFVDHECMANSVL